MASSCNLNGQQDSLTSARQLLKRSNALRIKSSNLDLLPCSLRESLLALRNSLNKSKKLEEEELTLLEQIKRGVKLRPVVRRYDTSSRPSRRRGIKEEDQDGTDRDSDQDESISSILMRVLRRRYLAMQHSDDDDDDDDDNDEDEDEESEMRSIGSGGRCGGEAATDASGPRLDKFVGGLVGFGGGFGGGCGANRTTRTVQHNTVNYCVLYGSGSTMTRDSRSQRRGDRQRQQQQQQQQRPCHGVLLMERLSGDSSFDTNERLAGKTPAGKLTNDLIVRL